MNSNEHKIDFIGGFAINDPNCLSCKTPLTRENAWMTDGCPCNSPLGCYNENEYRWRLLMELQQDDSHKLTREEHKPPKRLVDINGDIINEPPHYHECLKWGREMIDAMEAEDIDRSDMLVIVNRLAEEIRFTMVMLKDR